MDITESKDQAADNDRIVCENRESTSVNINSDQPEVSTSQEPPTRSTHATDKRGTLQMAWHTLTTSRSVQFLLIMILISVVVGVLAIVCQNQLIPWIYSFADFVRRNQNLTVYLYGILISCTCFPPIIGYSFLLVLSGYIFGVILGFFVNYVFALIGSCLCFYLARKVGTNVSSSESGVNSNKDITTCTEQTRPSDAFDSSSEAGSVDTRDPENQVENYREDELKKMSRVLTAHFKAHPARLSRLLFLIKLAPYPNNIMNVLLAQIPAIPSWEFYKTTAIALPKVFIHAWLGSTLNQLSDIFIVNNLTEAAKDQVAGRSKMSPVQIVQLCIIGVAVFLALAGSWYFYRVMKKAVKELEVKEGIQLQDVERVEGVTVSAATNAI
ncbi:hypothetical protein MP638_003348 [Amoeboaphelidium occidentale]|nr:hypothetical protein MP638_003348 [Amoeboaphelidium occidentale]